MMPNRTIDEGHLPGALATFLATAPSPAREPEAFADWSEAHGGELTETERSWFATQMRLIMLREAASDADAADSCDRVLSWLRALRIARHANDGDASRWMRALSAALLRDPARSTVGAALERWTAALSDPLELDRLLESNRPVRTSRDAA
jgi:hypothetical protein